MTQLDAFQFAVIWTDHHSAHILAFDAHRVHSQVVRAHEHPTRQHGSEVRSEHLFMGEICDAMEGYTEMLVCGSHAALSDFRHYAGKHRPQVAQRIAAFEVTDHLSDNELVALARRHFAKLLVTAGASNASRSAH